MDRKDEKWEVQSIISDTQPIRWENEKADTIHSRKLAKKHKNKTNTLPPNKSLVEIEDLRF